MLVVREILCATDVERPARAGLRYSYFLADRFQCSLHVVHAWQEPTATAGSHLSGAERMQNVHAAHRLRERLDEVVRAVPTGSSGRATTYVVDGELTAAVLASAERQRVDLIVLGSGAREDAGARAAGSVAECLTRQAACPVLTVPARAFGRAPLVKRILLVLPTAPTVGLTVEWTALWARQFGASVQLLYREGTEPSSVGNAALCRHEVEDKLRRSGVGVDAIFVEPGAGIAARVIHVAESARCDLVVMSAVLRDAEGQSVLGGLRAAGVLPVLSVRDSAPERPFVDNVIEGDFATSFVRQEAQAQDTRSRAWIAECER
ncbi:MAG TPA: universal stress protein [Polyangiaceae bacterium]